MSNRATVVGAPRRPIHYLGSKLRFATDIADVIDAVARPTGLVCDLFSGSGVVSSVVGVRRPVVAVDIQEYSRVLSSALLNPQPLEDDVIQALCAEIGSTPVERAIRDAWLPLVEYEHRAIGSARNGDPESLAELLDALPLVGLQPEALQQMSDDLRESLHQVAATLDRLGPNTSAATVFSRYYGGLYFGIEQAACLDILAMRCRGQMVLRGHRDTVLAALLGTASALVCSVGKQFAQPLRPRNRDGSPKANLWKRVESDRSLGALDEFRSQLAATSQYPGAMPGSRAVRADYRDYLASESDELAAVYADPPYTRDHYSRYYHVLETMALGDQPVVTKTNLDGGQRLSRGVYRAGRHQSPFSIISQAPRAFDELFRLTGTLGAPLVLSYSPQLDDGRSRPRVMSIDAILDLARTHFRSIERLDVVGVSHSKLTRSDLHLSAPETAEILLLLRP